MTTTDSNRQLLRVPIETVRVGDQIVLQRDGGHRNDVIEVVFHEHDRVAVRYQPDRYGSISSLAGPRGQMVHIARTRKES